MGFISGSVTYRRFVLSGAMSAKVDERLAAKLAEHAFDRHNAAAPDGVQVGWITTEHLFDTDLAVEKVAFGRYLLLAMRVDRTAAPGAVVKSYIRMEEQAAAQSEGLDHPSKTQRRQAREAALARAEQESRAGAFRRSASYPVLVDLSHQIVYFGSLGDAVGDRLYNLFRDTFDVSLTSLTAERTAHRCARGAGPRRALEDARAIHFIDTNGHGDGRNWPDLNFLGREFLTWLWHETATGRSGFQISERTNVAVTFTRFVQMDCDFDATGSVTVRREGPTAAPESRVALTTGKQPAKAGLVLAANGQEWSMSLDAERFAVSGMTVPASEEQERLGRLEERLDRISESAELLDGLYALFLDDRTSSNWVQSHQRIRAWVSGEPVRRVRGEQRVSA